MREVTYSQGMTNVWSDGEKIIISNTSGPRWVEENVDRIFGVGEWQKIKRVNYFEADDRKKAQTKSRTYEVISGYIPQRVIEDLSEKLPEDVKKKNALDALKDI